MAFALEYFLGTAPCTRQENYEISTRYVIMNENLKKIQTNISAQLSSLLAVLELLEGTSMTGEQAAYVDMIRISADSINSYAQRLEEENLKSKVFTASES